MKVSSNNVETYEEPDPKVMMSLKDPQLTLHSFILQPPIHDNVQYEQ